LLPQPVIRAAGPAKPTGRAGAVPARPGRQRPGWLRVNVTTATPFLVSSMASRLPRGTRPAQWQD